MKTRSCAVKGDENEKNISEVGEREQKASEGDASESEDDASEQESENASNEDDASESEKDVEKKGQPKNQDTKGNECT